MAKEKGASKPAPAGNPPKDFSFGMSVIRKSEENASQNRPAVQHHG